VQDPVTKGRGDVRMIKTLIVEDQELLRESLMIVLESISNVKVIGLAGNGEEAIRYCEENVPDIILMDIEMPVMGGVQATKEIKQRWPEIKVIILTTFKDIDNVRSALQAGAEGYILKAVDPEFLVRGIELVYHGGSLVPQDLAKEIFSSIGNATDSKQSNPYHLNQQELKILKYVAQGLQNKAISELMFLSLGTVKNYISSIYAKLDVTSRSSAITKATEERLISD
jgi:DNA-binding NarL/FixJ family response regulator